MKIHDILGKAGQAEITSAISEGADVNELDDEGLSPLMIAIERDLPECLTILLKLGADPTVNWPRITHCSWSRALAQPGGVKLTNALLDYVDDPYDLMRGGCPEGEETTYLWSCLFKLNHKGAGKLAQRLIDWGLDPNERLNTGLTPLLIAAHKADAKTCEVIDVLIATGADPSVSTEPNLARQKRREEELDAMAARGEDVSRLPRVLPHKPASVLDLAKANRKKTYEYFKSLLEIQDHQDRFEAAEAELAKIKKSECGSPFTEFAKKLELVLDCEAKPVRGCPALLRYSAKMSQLPPNANEDDGVCIRRLDPFQAESKDIGALLIHQSNVSSLKSKVKLMLIASDDWATAICASKTSAPNYSLTTRDIVNRLSNIYEQHAFDLLGCAKSFVEIRFEPIDQPLDLHNQLVRFCPDFDSPEIELTDDLRNAYRDGARCYLWWD